MVNLILSLSGRTGADRGTPAIRDDARSQTDPTSHARISRITGRSKANSLKLLILMSSTLFQ